MAASADLDDEDLRPRGGLRDLVATVTNSRRNLAIAGGGIAVLLLASMLAFCGGSSKPKPVASADKPTQTAEATAPEATEPVANPQPSEPAPSEGSAENLGPTAEELAAATEPPPDEASAESNDPNAQPDSAASSEPSDPSDTPTRTAKQTKAASTQTRTNSRKATTPKTTKTTAIATQTRTTNEPRPGANLGGKKVVAESDGQARAGKPIAGVDQSSLQKARSAYLSGNKRLFSGDAATAIKHYRQALAYYPGYVAAYRGLGVAYEKQGNKASAVSAFRTYVGSAPGAADAGTIKQRIAALSK